MVFLERQRLMQVFPEPVQKLWNFWELRVLVFVSLTLQLYLLHLGSRRRHSVKTWIKIFLWISYLSADSVATIALGVVSNDCKLHNELIAFWAPFLLQHLGGPDTITAYAVQDNELWLRHFLGLVVQSLVALYIFLLYFKANWLSFLTVLMLLSGFIKYAERIWVMRGISLPRYSSPDGMDSLSTEEVALKCFTCFRCLYLNQTIEQAELGYLIDTVPTERFIDPQNTWKLIELEHGYAYEFFYTKAPLFSTPWGLIFRFSFTSIHFVFIFFLLEERHKHLQVDLIITYLLLVGAIIVETYGVILQCVSDWPWRHLKWFWKDQKGWKKHLKTLSAKLIGEQRWSQSMAQLNLLSLCLKDKSGQVGTGTPKFFANLRAWAFNQILPKLNGDLEKLFNRTHKQVSTELIDLVYNTLWDKLRSNSNGFPEVYDWYITNRTEKVGKMEIYHRIIIWHIATDLCFYENSGANEPMDELRWKMIEVVSDYMMYILAMHPFVLSTGNAIRCFEKTREYVNVFFQSGKISKANACAALISRYGASNSASTLEVDMALEDDNLLGLACLLANNLKREMDRKWEILSDFWVLNLAYVASLCQGNNHAQLLRNGGEFLTLVWLLKEHLKIREYVQPQSEEHVAG